MENTNLFKSIAGYEPVKEELLRIREWVSDKYNIENPDIKLPKGILFYGEPGNGKTLFMKEYSESFNVPVINIQGNQDNISDEIHQAFVTSKQYEFSIILIDEIDLLIRRSDIERTLQAELDGIDSNGNVLVLASTNSLHDLADALIRAGRFDRVIEIKNPNRESRKELLLHYLKKLRIESTVDTDYLSRVFHGVSCADIAVIINDAYLRFGNKPTTESIEESFYRLGDIGCAYCGVFNPDKANLETAYHEVAHAMLIYKYKEYYRFYKAFFSKETSGGLTRFFPIDEDKETSESHFQRIDIELAGYVMTKLKFHRLDDGTISDLQDCRSYAVLLVNKLGYKGPQFVLPYYSNGQRMESSIRKRGNERAIERIIKKRLKVVKRYLKKHIAEADALAAIMMKKGYIDYSDLTIVMEHVQNKQINEIFFPENQLARESI